ncbi:crotonase/enoyl-CoA hydratase family protein [Nocardioides limicola]|uniref:crotonase/enoyl-CoA hydratase family protein n=1 Tax=Nocardioides limicola TaxID=2803368 RepID=UPI00193C59CE|nr:crotonase/enoyl-CoA hydratase family protein [Nocardioides sp. DJM-14]
MTTVDTGEPTVLMSRQGHVAIITMNRPHVMNAVNAEMSVAMEECIDELVRDPKLRVGILTGAGRAFSAGADLKEVAAGRSLQAPHQRERGWGGFMRRMVDKPLIAAVNGYALGGGTEMMLACDLAVVGASAKLGLPEVSRGIIAAGGGLLRLGRRVPQAIAMEAALTGKPITAETALGWGLVNRVVADDQVLDAALELADAVARNAPLAVQASKRLIQHGHALGSDWTAEAWAASDREITAIMRSDDANEGPRAFAEKRQPQWSGR